MPGQDHIMKPAVAVEGTASTVHEVTAAPKTQDKAGPISTSLPTISQPNGHVAPDQDRNGAKPKEGMEAASAPATADPKGQQVPALRMTEGEYRSMMGQFLVSHQQRESFVDSREDKKKGPPISSTFDSPPTNESSKSVPPEYYRGRTTRHYSDLEPLRLYSQEEQAPPSDTPQATLNVKGTSIAIPDYFGAVRRDGYVYDLDFGSPDGRSYAANSERRRQLLNPPTPDHLRRAEARYRQDLVRQADEEARLRYGVDADDSQSDDGYDRHHHHRHHHHHRSKISSRYAGQGPPGWAHIAREARKKGKRRRERLRTGYSLLKNQCMHVMKEVRKRTRHEMKLQRDMVSHNRKIVREMQKFWNRHEKEIAERQKKADRDAALERKREEEEREALRQRRKLNFLLTQTELFSHFIASKMGTVEGQNTDSPSKDPGTSLENIDSSMAQADVASIDFEEDVTEEEVKRKAASAAKLMLDNHKNTVQQFDQSYSKTSAAAAGATEDSGTSMLNPSTMPEMMLHEQPRSLKATLKSYQLKGLNWLANLYDQGINGILADEMGLGKTIQSISLLLHLAEARQIWGPFIVVSPVSTLHNWVNEIKRFAPSLVVLPYWGSVKDRKIIRKRWNPDKLYKKDAPFHVLVTSYQLAVSDMAYFKKLKWQYLVLDEAQALKSSSSLRWQTLLKFKCRNRLLLTGTPIQNSMAELWALLHFIMPTLFDSHAEFSEWFSKDIESKSQNAESDMNERQVSRLHMILKPFMLRRVKKDVVNEMAPKIEVQISCELTPRQQEFYDTIRDKVPIADLLDNGGLSEDSRTETLMNLVMQFRKVCNHPDIFQRRDTKSPFVMVREGASLGPTFETVDLRTLTPRQVVHPSMASTGIISYTLPKLLFDQGLTYEDGMGHDSTRLKWLQCNFNILTAHYIHRSLFGSGTAGGDGGDSMAVDQRAGQAVQVWDPLSMAAPDPQPSSCFAFTRLSGLSPQMVMTAGHASVATRYLLLAHCWHTYMSSLANAPVDVPIPSSRQLLVPGKAWRAAEYAPASLLQRLQSGYGLIKRLGVFCPPVVSIAPFMLCSRRRAAIRYQQALTDQVTKVALIGRAALTGDKGERRVSSQRDRVPLCSPVVSLREALAQREDELALTSQTFPGLIAPVLNTTATSPIFVPNMGTLLADSGKMRALDQLLTRLKSEGHRVLIYSQMTKMIDILEDFMVYRKHRHLRLDGASSLADRRDMVEDFQTDPDIFVFLLSTRAGGLGINLVAADTVIFYDSDWNPTMDAQAMDRAHRLGQTRQVTVYRMITRRTVEEKILKRAQEKAEIQNIVIKGGNFKQDVFRKEEVVNLLLDEDDARAIGASEGSGEKKGHLANTGSGADDDVVVDLDADEVLASSSQPVPGSGESAEIGKRDAPEGGADDSAAGPAKKVKVSK